MAYSSRLKVDFQKIRRNSASEILFRRMFNGCEDVINNAITLLSSHNADLIIAILLKSNSDLKTVFANLANIDLPMKIGVIFGLDKYVDHVWLAQLKEQIQRISHRFVFVEPIKTTSLPTEVLAYSKLTFLSPVYDAMQQVGMKNLYRYMVIFTVLREQIRLIIKGLECKYVLWLDADELAPQDVITKLTRHQANIVAGWAIDRHYPFEKTTFEAVNEYKPGTQEEIEYYQYAKDFSKMLNMVVALEMLQRFGVDSASSFSHAYVVAPSKLKRETELIEAVMTGFGCVLLSKSASDANSHICDRDEELSEDAAFCYHARKAGYRIFVDPTCYLEHIEDASVT